MYRGRRAEEDNENVMLEFTDAYHHKGGSKSSDDYRRDDFTDNSRGYCKLDKLDEIDELNTLTETHFTDVGDFLYTYVYDDGTTYSEAISELKEWVKLVKKYLPKDLENFFTDEQILQTVMIMNARGESKFLTADCIAAIQAAAVKSIADFNTLMNVGDAFIAPDEFMSASSDPVFTNKETVLLDVVEDGITSGASTFDIFINYVLHYYAVFNPNTYFNQDYLDNVRSWQELALTPVSITAKFAAVQLAWGEQLEEAFAGPPSFAPALQAAYQDVFDRCNAPTQVPSMAPSFGPSTANEELTVVAVVSQVSSSVTAADIAASFTAFRARFTKRKFCLLQPQGSKPEDIKAPQAFFLDPLTTYATVSMDNGDIFSRSNWYDLCNLRVGDDLGIGIIPYFIGSTSTKTRVRESEDFFEEIVAGRGQTITTVGTPGATVSPNWIQPFVADFIPP